MITLEATARTLLPQFPQGATSDDLATIAEHWLNQDEVQQLLQAAWDPALRFEQEILPYESVYEDPATGELIPIRATTLTVTAFVNGVEYGAAITISSGDPYEGEITLAERKVRKLIVEAAVRGPKKPS